jgi:hypothetical protein
VTETDKIHNRMNPLPNHAADTLKPKELQRGDCNGTFQGFEIPAKVNTNGAEHFVYGRQLGS